jgi:hypothetical protein
MVKIVELSQDDIIDRLRYSRLVTLAREVLPAHRVSEISTCFSVYPNLDSLTDSLIVFPHNNTINAASLRAFGNAIKLAHAYEDRGEPEFTVKKGYRE